MIFIVNPIGNFPLDDDWVYAHPVLSLINNGTYGSTGWSVSTIVAQVLWGFLFCKVIGGFSFTTLRFSTLVLGLLSVIILYFLVYNSSKNKKLSFIAALFFLANPIFFCCSNTFMTDVPFVSFALLSTYFFLIALENNNFKFLIMATLFSVLAVLVRQVGMVIPLAYAIATSIKWKQPMVRRIAHFVPFLISAAAYEIYLAWLRHNGVTLFWMPTSDFPTLLTFFSSSGTRNETAQRLGQILFYFGLLFLPLLLIIKINYSILLREARLKIIIIVLVVCIAISYILFYRFNGFKGILNYNYIGRHTLSDYQLFRDSINGGAPALWYILGISGGVLLSIHLISGILKIVCNYKTANGSLTPTTTKHLFVALCIVGYALLILYPWTNSDRYLIPLFAWYCVFISFEPQIIPPVKKPVYIFTAIYVSIMILFSAFVTHDYLSWNRSRWAAVSYLTTDLNIPMHNIDAGWEANGWLTGYGRKWDSGRPWNVIDGHDYILSFEDVDGYQTIYKIPYTSYIPPFDRYIYVSHSLADEEAQYKKSILNSNQKHTP